MMASGRLRRGFFASSPAAATLSRPMKEKKMTPAAAVMPAKPNGAKLARLSEFQPWTPMTMNMIRTPILMTTMTALVFADSLTPRISSSAHMMIRITAGRLMMPPCSGAFDTASGIWTAEDVAEELVEVLRPADGDGRAGHAPLEQQAGADPHAPTNSPSVA